METIINMIRADQKMGSLDQINENKKVEDRSKMTERKKESGRITVINCKIILTTT